MILITLSKCPDALRGDLTKWLFEINTNVFAGRVSARVRDQLWDRIRQHCKDGRATMVFSTNNEQHFDFRVHNTEWMPVDFDGLHLMLRPDDINIAGTDAGCRYSNASRYLLMRQKQRGLHNTKDTDAIVYTDNDSYVIINVETIESLEKKDRILRLSALHASKNGCSDSVSILFRQDVSVASNISELTEITDTILEGKGECLSAGLEKFLSFIGNHTIVAYNARLSMMFIDNACKECSLESPTNKTRDIGEISKRKLYDQKVNSVARLADYFEIDYEGKLSGLDHCKVLMKIYEKLKEKSF